MKFAGPLLAAGLLALAPATFAASNATQTVTTEVQAINDITITGTPSLTISTATAGQAPDPVTDTAAYAITTNETGKKITAAINLAMDSGVTLKLEAQAPAGAAATVGGVALSTTAADLVTGISTLNETGKTLTYTLSATSAAGVVASADRTVTLTIADAAQ